LLVLLPSSFQAMRVRSRMADSRQLKQNTSAPTSLSGAWVVGDLGQLVASNGRLLAWTSRNPYSVGEWTLEETVNDATAVEAGRDGNIRASLLCREVWPAGPSDCDSAHNLRVAYMSEGKAAVVYQGDSGERGIFMPWDECDDPNKVGLCDEEPCPICMCAGETVAAASKAVDEALASTAVAAGGDCLPKALKWAIMHRGLSQMLGCQRTAMALQVQLMSTHGPWTHASVPPGSDWAEKMAEASIQAKSSIVLVLVDFNERKGSARHALLIETFADDSARIYNSWVHGFTLVDWLGEEKSAGIASKLKGDSFGQGFKLTQEQLKEFFELVAIQLGSNRLPSEIRATPKSCA